MIDFRLTIEGNIGSGKSTLISNLEGQFGLDIVLEPVEFYLDFHGFNLLKEQQDRDQQMCCQVAIADLLFMRANECTSGRQLVERGNTSVRVFIEFYKERFTELEYKCLINHMETLDACKSPAKVDKVIYLRSSPETALARVKRRGRSGEESIDIDFLMKLSNLHDSLLLGRPDVVTINADEPASQVRNKVAAVIAGYIND